MLSLMFAAVSDVTIMSNVVNVLHGLVLFLLTT